MITNFKCSDTKALFDGCRVARFSNFAAVAVRKLQQVNAATTLDFLRVSPGNRLEQLSGNRAGNTVSASMINGACALCGRREMLVQLKLLITIEEVAMKREIPLIHPGEILLEDFLKPMGITQYRLAKEIGVPQRRIGQICSGQRAITPDTALRLAAFFGTDAQSWVNLQAHYDTEQARVAMEDRLANIHKYQPVAAY